MVNRDPVNYLFLIITLVSLMMPPAKPDLNDFVENKMYEYGPWLRVNNLDPSPITEESRYLFISTIFFNLEFEISNLVTENHSRNIRTDSISSNLPAGHFQSDFTMDAVLFSGDYTVNGTLQADKPVSFNGTWHFTVRNLKAEFSTQFVPTSSGNFNLTSFMPRFPVITLEDVHFDNLSESLALVGYEEFFRDELTVKFTQYLEFETSTPIPILYLRYWREILAETTLEDIISATGSPPSTPGMGSTTPTSTGTTLSPSHKLKQFVERKLSNNYATWLNSSSQNPSPLVPGPNYFRTANAVAKLDGYFENHGVEFNSPEISQINVEADFQNRWFNAHVFIRQGVRFFGQFKANGTIHSCSHISGEGSWYMNAPYLEYYDFNISFTADPSGFLQVSDFDLSNLVMHNRQGTGYFEEILECEAAERFEEFVRDAITLGMIQYLQSDGNNLEHPLRLQYLHFWQQILAETTMEDILA